MALASRILLARAKIPRETRRRRKDNARIVERLLRDAGVAAPIPEHGTTMVVRLPARHRDDVRFARRLLAKEGILVAPGSYWA